MIADILLQQQGFQTETKLPVNEREILPDMDRGDLESCQHPDFAPLATAKSHICHMPWMHKAVFLLRQPADSLVSHFHFHTRYPALRAEAEIGLDAFCLKYAEQWYDHAMSFVWACEEKPEHFIPVTYESLLDSTEKNLRHVLIHLEINASDDQVTRAISNHGFENYLGHEPERTPNERFFRRGKKDSGKSELAQKTFNRINRLCWPLYERAMALREDVMAKAMIA